MGISSYKNGIFKENLKKTCSSKWKFTIFYKGVYWVANYSLDLPNFKDLSPFYPP